MGKSGKVKNILFVMSGVENLYIQNFRFLKKYLEKSPPFYPLGVGQGKLKIFYS
jgi:hypothetical protein